jgi:hypothetical protein
LASTLDRVVLGSNSLLGSVASALELILQLFVLLELLLESLLHNHNPVEKSK